MWIQLLLYTASVTCDEVVTVQGRLRGIPYDGYVSYVGIPYGSVNETTGRFKRTGLAPFWLGVREPSLSTCTPSKIDDCLKLDVHVPTSGSSIPVLVWVRGISGNYNPENLVRKDIIVVVVYHRLGAPGFLCLKDDKIPGNAGVKDVVSALRWIRDNIVAFKGNPAQITIAGQGFGAAMVEAVTLSSNAQGLYHGVILQSGSVLNPSYFNYNADKRAKLLAKKLNPDENASSVLLKADLHDLVDRTGGLNVPYFPFGICVEKENQKDEPLLIDSPYHTMYTKKMTSVPMIIGYNSNEAYIFAYALKQAKVARRMAKDMAFLLPSELKFVSEREVEQTARQIKDMYFKRNITMAALLEYHGDAYFISHVHRSVRLRTLASQPVYYYQFSYPGDPGVYPEPGLPKTGAAHSDELAYLFSEGRLDGDDEVVQNNLVKLWSNFVKTLNPTPSREAQQWEPTNAHTFPLLDIGVQTQMRQFPRARAAQLWDDIYEKYYYGRYE